MVAISEPTKLTSPTKHRFTVGQYYQIAEIGILGIEQRTELIDGEIIEMSPIGVKHAGSINRLNRVFANLVGDNAIISIQNSIQLNNYSEPQPDLAILRWREDYYTESLPIISEILLLIEVSDSTLKYDREVKSLLYAKAGIPELWIANLETQVFEVYRQPSETGYQEVQTYGKGEVISLQMLTDITIAVDDIMNFDFESA